MTAHQVRPYVPGVNTDRRTDQQYEIRVRGHLERRWSAWFDGLDLTRQDDGTTVICGPVADQAALHGLLQRLRDIGIPLISLTPIAPVDPHTHPSLHNPSGATP